MLALPHHTLVICGFYFNNARQSRVFEELLFCVSDGMLKCRNCFRNPRRILDRPFLKASFIHPFLSTSFFLFPSSASLFSNFHHFHVPPPHQFWLLLTWKQPFSTCVPACPFFVVLFLAFRLFFPELLCLKRPPPLTPFSSPPSSVSFLPVISSLCY